MRLRCKKREGRIERISSKVEGMEISEGMAEASGFQVHAFQCCHDGTAVQRKRKVEEKEREKDKAIKKILNNRDKDKYVS